ncbi:MAG: hypothetical protein ACPGJS_12350 [Flammeovirgaceae bacterium]
MQSKNLLLLFCLSLLWACGDDTAMNVGISTFTQPKMWVIHHDPSSIDTIYFEYDEDGWLIKQRRGNSYIDLKYNDDQLINRAEYFSNGALSSYSEVVYNANRLPMQETFYRVNAGSDDLMTQINTYTFDNQGNITSRTRNFLTANEEYIVNVTTTNGNETSSELIIKDDNVERCRSQQITEYDDRPNAFQAFQFVDEGIISIVTLNKNNHVRVKSNDCFSGGSTPLPGDWESFFYYEYDAQGRIIKYTETYSGDPDPYFIEILY